MAGGAKNGHPPVGTGRPLRMLEVRPVQPMVELAFQSESVLSRSGRLKQEGLVKPDLALQYGRQISLGAADGLCPLVIGLEADAAENDLAAVLQSQIGLNEAFQIGRAHV